MFLPQTRKVMIALRETASRIRSNNKKIDDWVDRYVNDCVLNGGEVQIITQWCLSKDLETRRERQGGVLKPLDAEERLIQEAIPRIIRSFHNNGIRVSWWFTCNRAFTDRGRISDELADEYVAMVHEMIGRVPGLSENSIVLDWEREVLGGRPGPSQEVLDDFTGKVSQEAFRVDMENLMRRVKKFPVNLRESEEALRRGTEYKIACEAEEGRFLTSSESPFTDGRFILVPLEFPERYVFFGTLAPGFQQRIAALVKPYPWRMDADELSYEE